MSKSVYENFNRDFMKHLQDYRRVESELDGMKSLIRELFAKSKDLAKVMLADEQTSEQIKAKNELKSMLNVI